MFIRKRSPRRAARWLAGFAILSLAGCLAQDEEGPAVARSQLVASCVDDPSAAPEQAWTCPESLVVECASPQGTPVDEIYVVPSGTRLTCETLPALDVEPGPFGLGETTVTATAGGIALCSATVVVEDTTPPSATAKSVTLWPPNHEMHTIDVEDCVSVTDACDETVDLRFTDVSVDEPSDGTGDGESEPDVVVEGCYRVHLRAERQGHGDGRVYRLGWIAEDASGNAVDGTCMVSVPHDQGAGGEAIASDFGETLEIMGCGP